MPSNNGCTSCGNCCCPVASVQPCHLEQTVFKYPGEQEFMRKYWIPITKDEALVLQPDKNVMEFGGREQYYKCLLFDMETRSCKDYENRCPACRNYLCNDARERAVEDYLKEIVEKYAGDEPSISREEVIKRMITLVKEEFGLVLDTRDIGSLTI